jgi:tRNA(Ile2) C34 agmatinyltransferase TiaS
MSERDEPLVTRAFPIKSPALRRYVAGVEGRCPECGGELDTGWECNDCEYDARDEAYPLAQRERDAKLLGGGK